jgi:predicted nucleic acid-binding protein
MIVVSDTSPLNYLVLIGRVPLLETLYREVIIPPAVAKELSHPRSPPATRSFIERPPHWLKIHAPPPDVYAEVNAHAARDLSAGELEAISLAKALRADLLLTDERRATREAREKYQLRVTGLLGVLELAAVRGLIELPVAIRELEQTNFRSPPAIVSRLLLDNAQRRHQTT